MVKVKNEFVVIQSTNKNKKWEKEKGVSIAVKDAYINEYRNILDLINVFGGYITKENMHKLLKFEYSKSGIVFILKKLYNKGCLNTYTMCLNKDDQKELKKREILLFAFTKRTNQVINGKDVTVNKPTKTSVLKQNYRINYFVNRYGNALKNSFKKMYINLSEEDKNKYIYKLYKIEKINHLLQLDLQEQRKELDEARYFDQLILDKRKARKVLKEHFDNNKDIQITTEDFQDFKDNFKQYDELDLNIKTKVLAFIKKIQNNNTMISFNDFNKFAGDELEKAGYIHRFKEEEANRIYQEQRLSIGHKMRDIRHRKPEGWEQDLYIYKMQLKKYEKASDNARLKVIKKSLKWDAENNRYDVIQKEEMDSLLRLRALNTAITSFKVKEKQVIINIDIYDVYYKKMTPAEIVDKIINVKYVLEALINFYDVNGKAVKDSDLLIKYNVKSFRGFDGKKIKKVEMLLRHQHLLMHQLIDDELLQYHKVIF